MKASNPYFARDTSRGVSAVHTVKPPLAMTGYDSVRYLGLAGLLLLVGGFTLALGRRRV